MHQVTFSICYEIKVHFLSNSCCQTKHTDLSKFFSRWLILRFLRLFTFNFIYENNSFRFKSEFKGHKLLCKFATKNNPETIDTVLIDYPSTFTNALILDKKIFPFSSFICHDSIRFCEASFHLEAILHIDAKSTCCNEIIEAAAERQFDNSITQALSLTP